jgi:hypothetical protein
MEPGSDRWPAGSALPGTVVESIVSALHGLRFGTVEITVHEGKVVQIERKEKLRLNGRSQV